MPLHTPGLSRRAFLARSSAALAGMAVLRTGWGADEKADPHRLALFSDTHVPGSPDVLARETNMTANLQQVVREVLALKSRPSAVIVNGDCAFNNGLPEDYANFSKCTAPLIEAGLPLHLTMGNHDDRGSLYGALQSQKPEKPLVESRHVTVVESPHANWFLLDSLIRVNYTPGEIGAEQREWLARALTSHADKPAIVMAHHTPQFEAPAAGKDWGGLKDTREFIELLTSFKHVKAFIFGHSHDWSVKRQANLQLINLPPVAYVFAAGKPNGWVLADVRENGLHLQLQTIDPLHKQQGERVELTWA